jgi:teichuronic acid biosynthesis protein TuaF
MKETLNRIWMRFKKLFILIILIPFLAAGAAYLFQKEGPSSYTANAEIRLANLDQDLSPLEFTDAEFAKTHITSNTFLNQLKEKHPDLDIETVKSKINFVIKPAKVLGISYTGNKPEETEETLKSVINLYIKESKIVKQINIDSYEKQKSQVGRESGETPAQFDLMILGLKEVKILNDVKLDQPQESTKNTAVFGFLIGLILSSMILLLPEVFRK